METFLFGGSLSVAIMLGISTFKPIQNKNPDNVKKRIVAVLVGLALLIVVFIIIDAISETQDNSMKTDGIPFVLLIFGWRPILDAIYLVKSKKKGE